MGSKYLKFTFLFFIFILIFNCTMFNHHPTLSQHSGCRNELEFSRIFFLKWRETIDSSQHSCFQFHLLLPGQFPHGRTIVSMQSNSFSWIVPLYYPWFPCVWASIKGRNCGSQILLFSLSGQPLWKPLDFIVFIISLILLL